MGTPKIIPFHFPAAVMIEQKFKVLCAVSSGDPPFQFKWKKDGDFMKGTQNIGIADGSDSSTFTIKRVSLNDAGNYTCTASNMFGVDNFHAKLVVNAPPKWIVEPTDIMVTAGDMIVSHCSAIAYPPPVIKWSKKDTVIEELFLNGTIIIPNAKKLHSGSYTCTVSNNVGSGLSKNIQVLVKMPAKFQEKHSVEIAKKGESARLVCESQGDQPLHVTWWKGNRKIDRSGNTNLEIFETVTQSGLRSDLYFSKTEREDGAVYTCKAENDFGKDERTSKLLIVEVPGEPQDVKVRETWSRSASVVWSPPYSGNSPISKYVIQYWRDTGSAHRLQEIAITGSQNSALVTGLSPGSTYQLTILAENAVGVGKPSPAVKLHTGEEEPTAAPTDFQAEARGPTTIRVSWKAPPPDEWNGVLLGYYVGYRPVKRGQNYPYSYKTSDFRPNATHEYFLTNLEKGVEYTVIVKAYNQAGSGPPTHELHVKTLDGDVPLPPKIFVTGTASTSITITWHPQLPASIKGFVLHYREEEGNKEWKEVNVDSRTSSYTIVNLDAGTLYQIYVSSSNEYGMGDPSEMITVRTTKAGLLQSTMLGDANTPFILNPFIMIPVLASAVTIIVVIVFTYVCLQRIKRRPPTQPAHTLDRSKRYLPVSSSTQEDKAPSASTTSRHPEKQPQYSGMSQRYVEVQPPPLPPDHPCALYPAPYATLPMTEELEAKMARHNVNQEMKTFLQNNRELPTPPGKGVSSLKKKDSLHSYDSCQ